MFMPGIVWKSVHGKKYMVLRWKKWENGQSRVTKEIYIGDEERLMEYFARMTGNPMARSLPSVYDARMIATAPMLKTVGVMKMKAEIMGGRGSGVSPGDYVLAASS